MKLSSHIFGKTIKIVPHQDNKLQHKIKNAILSNPISTIIIKKPTTVAVTHAIRPTLDFNNKTVKLEALRQNGF